MINNYMMSMNWIVLIIELWPLWVLLGFANFFVWNGFKKQPSDILTDTPKPKRKPEIRGKPEIVIQNAVVQRARR